MLFDGRWVVVIIAHLYLLKLGNMEHKELIFFDESDNEVYLHDIGSFNKGNNAASKLLSQSVFSFGCGRSILVDSQNNIISGTKIANAATSSGIRKARIIETTGDELIVVKRTDINARTKKGYELSLVDNLAHDKNLNWDADALYSAMQETLSFNPRDWGGHSCLVKELNIEELLKDDVEKKRNASKQNGEIRLDVQQYSLF